MRLVGVLVAALALAGCADEPTTAFAPPRTDDPIPPGVYQSRAAPEFNATLADAGYALGPPEERQLIPLTIPNGTTRVLVEIIFMQGAATGFSMRLAGCAFDADVVPGDGRNITKDCGGLYPGENVVEVSAAAGSLTGRVVVTASVCSQGPGTCYRSP